ncbi:hypothetical protein F4780DRAFT_730682 [Xylariomycetidae sp. FL0641]|nr:hypothetical protein F4780DRAFT_730682 [Xylariomycetidae sp. FL0641]
MKPMTLVFPEIPSPSSPKRLFTILAAYPVVSLVAVTPASPKHSRSPLSSLFSSMAFIARPSASIRPLSAAWKSTSSVPISVPLHIQFVMAVIVLTIIILAVSVSCVLPEDDCAVLRYWSKFIERNRHIARCWGCEDLRSKQKDTSQKGFDDLHDKCFGVVRDVSGLEDAADCVDRLRCVELKPMRA